MKRRMKRRGSVKESDGAIVAWLGAVPCLIDRGNNTIMEAGGQLAGGRGGRSLSGWRGRVKERPSVAVKDSPSSCSSSAGAAGGKEAESRMLSNTSC